VFRWGQVYELSVSLYGIMTASEERDHARRKKAEKWGTVASPAEQSAVGAFWSAAFAEEHGEDEDDDDRFGGLHDDDARLRHIAATVSGATLRPF
jgi:hypothetical protein